jgi:cyclohexanecarboxyl-CoA dehydrogenase
MAMIRQISGDDALFAETLRRYAIERLMPDYQRWRSEPYPADRIPELGELGVLGLRVPEEFGGSAATFPQLGLAVEELCRGDFNVNYFLQLSALAAELIKHGDAELQGQYLPALATGEETIAFALTEPGVGSDAANLSCRARRDGSDWIITGEKASISFAGFAQSTTLFARTGGAGARGITCFLVPLDLPGVERQVYRSAGSAMTARGSLHFDDVRIPAHHQIGEEGTGFVLAMQGFDYNRAVIAHACIGAAAQSLDEFVEYAKQRETFGKPLARHEGIAFQVAEHLSLLHSARLLARETLELAEAGLPHTTQASMAKWLGPKYSAEAIHAVIRMFGWPGYSADMHHELRMKDVMGLEIGDGTPEIMKSIIARETFGREYASHR